MSNSSLRTSRKISNMEEKDLMPMRCFKCRSQIVSIRSARTFRKNLNCTGTTRHYDEVFSMSLVGGRKFGVDVVRLFSENMRVDF